MSTRPAPAGTAPHVEPVGSSHELVLAAIGAGLLDAYVVLLGGYTFQGGALPPPPEFAAFQQTHQPAPARKVLASELVWERALHFERFDALSSLLSERELLQEELKGVLRVLQALDSAGPGEAAVEHFVATLEGVELFVRSAYRSLGMELVQLDQDRERSIH